MNRENLVSIRESRTIEVGNFYFPTREYSYFAEDGSSLGKLLILGYTPLFLIKVENQNSYPVKFVMLYDNQKVVFQSTIDGFLGSFLEIKKSR